MQTSLSLLAILVGPCLMLLGKNSEVCVHSGLYFLLIGMTGQAGTFLLATALFIPVAALVGRFMK